MTVAHLGERPVEDLGLRGVVIDFSPYWLASGGHIRPDLGFDLDFEIGLDDASMRSARQHLRVEADDALVGEALRSRWGQPGARLCTAIQYQILTGRGATFDALDRFLASHPLTTHTDPSRPHIMLAPVGGDGGPANG
jgi:hypothetical protein